jgi:two-component system phosphate regulon response regulator PhoB
MTTPPPSSVPPRDATKVLVIDDEQDLRELLAFNLQSAGFAVETASTAGDGVARLVESRPDVVVLDLMLPDMPGIEVCRRVRTTREVSNVAILMLTARGDEYDRLLGFEAGADDYVVKPFSVREVVHRVRALTRRSATHPPPADRLSWRDLSIDVGRGRVTIGSTEVKLRPLEFRLLEALLRSRGQVMTRAQLLAAAWGITDDVHTRTVDTHVRRLREALGSYGDGIETLRGFGYRFREE